MGYCTNADVRRFLPRPVIIEGENPTPSARNPNAETLTLADLAEYIEQADEYINSKINAIYEVPLKKVNIGGTVKYPSPIPLISARLAAKLIFEQRLSGSDRQPGEFPKAIYDQAILDLNAVVRGNSRLLGQGSNISSRFARSSWHSVPPNPVKDPPDKA